MSSKKSLVWSILILLLLLWHPAGIAGDSRWHLIKELRGIQIYSRSLPDTPYKEYRGEVEVNAKPDRVVRLFQNLSSISEWHYRTKKVEVLDLIDMTNAYVHIINTPPWPIRPRDVVCKISLRRDTASNGIRITLSSVDGQLPVTEEYVRTNRLEAEWLIRPVSETKSSLRYQVYVDPGGSIPIWLFNTAAMNVPLFTLSKLRRRFASEED